MNIFQNKEMSNQEAFEFIKKHKSRVAKFDYLEPEVITNIITKSSKYDFGPLMDYYFNFAKRTKKIPDISPLFSKRHVDILICRFFLKLEKEFQTKEMLMPMDIQRTIIAQDKDGLSPIAGYFLYNDYYLPHGKVFPKEFMQEYYTKIKKSYYNLRDKRNSKGFVGSFSNEMLFADEVNSIENIKRFGIKNWMLKWW